MIMKSDFVRSALYGGLLGFLAGVAAMASPAGVEYMAVKIKNINFVPPRIAVKAGNIVSRTNEDDIRQAVASNT